MSQYTVVRGVDCEVCAATPVVGINSPNGEDVICTNLCGCCFFGESMMIDPDRWNDPLDASE